MSRHGTKLGPYTLHELINSGGMSEIWLATDAGGASVAVRLMRNQSAFASAKAAVVHFSKAMAIELGGHGILVNAIAPGSILTDGTRKLFYGEDQKGTEMAKAMIAHIPLGRPGEVEEIANAALFLAAPESSYITGVCLTVDGGWTAGFAREF